MAYHIRSFRKQRIIKESGKEIQALIQAGWVEYPLSPLPAKNLWRRWRKRVIKPSVLGLQKDNIDYKGFLFIGLMNQGGDPYVIEYNVRMGDPETEVVMPRLKTDLVALFDAVARNELDKAEVEIDPRACVTVMLVSGGYPEAYEKGKIISGLDEVKGSMLFHAGTTLKDGKVVTNGGRVIAISSLADNYKEALATSFKNAEIVTFDKKYYRRDIGFDL